MTEITIDDNNFVSVLVTKDHENKDKIVVDFILADDTTVTVGFPLVDIYRTLNDFPLSDVNKKMLMVMNVGDTQLNIRGSIFLNALVEAKEKAES